MSGWLASVMSSYQNLQGNEKIVADTALAGGASPQTVGLYLNQIAPANVFRDILDGSDFTINPWQRGTSFTGIAAWSSVFTNYTADRWFAYGGASSSISVSRQAITAGALPGYNYALQFGRASSNTNTAAINLVQIVETADVYRLQGQPLVLSMYAIAGANFSAAGGNVSVKLISGTGTNEGASALSGGTWTGQTTVSTNTISVTSASYVPGAPFVVQMGTVPSTATELALVISYTPVGTAGANDWIQIPVIQMEVGLAPSQFERLDVQVELEICQRYFWATSEPAAGVIVGAGMNPTTSTNIFYLAAPVQFRTAPSMSVSAGTFKTNQAGTATACTITAGTTHTVNAVSVNGNSTGTAGQATLLQGGGGSGYIWVSADL